MTLRHERDVLETDRLVLRRIRSSDFDFFARIHADPLVAQYIGARTVDESLAWLDATILGYERIGLGQLAVERRSDGLLLGRCGLSDLAIEVDAGLHTPPRCWWSRGEVPGDVSVSFARELGYTFDRAHWGRGYAGEAAEAVLAYARNVLAISGIVSIIHPENVRSQRVATCLGAVKGPRVELPGGIMDLYAWPGRSQE